MIRALIDGRKTQTRRVLHPQPPIDYALVGIYAPGLTAVFNPGGRDKPADPDWDVPIRLPYMPGDRLWVREAWRTERAFDPYRPRDLPWIELPDLPIFYEATPNGDLSPLGNRWGERKRPGMFMPRLASRLTLIVDNVRIQRIKDIDEADAIAEGVWHGDTFERFADDLGATAIPGRWFRTARDWYRDLWDRLNAARGFHWEADPWVVAPTFRMVKRNIDDLERDAS
jgi:hypothetical protein